MIVELVTVHGRVVFFFCIFVALRHSGFFSPLSVSTVGRPFLMKNNGINKISP